MGYKGFMGYVVDFPASQLERWDFLWVMGGYGLREVWVIRVSTVDYRKIPSIMSSLRIADLWDILERYIRERRAGAILGEGKNRHCRVQEERRQ